MSPPLQGDLPDLSTPLSELFQKKSTPDAIDKARDSKEARESAMWSIYQGEAEKYDKAVTGAQKEDANGVLVFTGLFSAVVAVFIVESYKKLSPDSGDTTTALLTQISQQLAGFRNNTYPQPTATAAFSPPVAILYVNALWFLSLVIAIASAFYVMLVQQWIRRHKQTIAELPSDHGHIRSYLFLGTQKYKMSHAIGFIPLPLHISVFLFFTGLIIFLYTISNAMANVVTVAVAIIGLFYLILTILPIVDEACPYNTPMSNVWFHLQHMILSAGASGCHLVVKWYRNRSGPDLDPRPGRLSNLSKFLEDLIEKNNLNLKSGIRGSMFQHAMTVPGDVDLSTLTWLLQRPIMGEKGEFQTFLHSIPPQILVQLSSLKAESGKKTICDHLFHLFQGCLGNKDKLDETVRDKRLRICLDAFYQIVKPSSLPDKDPEVVLQYVWSNFKELDTVRKLWDNDGDPAIRIFSRSICAHLSRNIIRKSKPGNLEKYWLRAFVGKNQEDAIFDPQLPNHLSTWDHFTLESFVFGVLPCLKDSLKPEHAACFVETLAVLMNAGNSDTLSKEIFSKEIFSFMEWVKECDREHGEEVAAALDQLFSNFFADPTSEHQ